MLTHSAFFYGTEHQFLSTIGPVLEQGMARSDALLAVTTAANIELLRAHLVIREARLTHPHTVSDRGTSSSPDYTDPERFALGR
jgi:hypothetical protein